MITLWMYYFNTIVFEVFAFNSTTGIMPDQKPHFVPGVRINHLCFTQQQFTVLHKQAGLAYPAISHYKFLMNVTCKNGISPECERVSMTNFE